MRLNHDFFDRYIEGQATWLWGTILAGKQLSESSNFQRIALLLLPGWEGKGDRYLKKILFYFVSKFYPETPISYLLKTYEVYLLG